MVLPYSLIRTKRRTLALQISKNGELIVRAPLRISISFIENFIREKNTWIKKHTARMKEREGTQEYKHYSDNDVTLMKEKLREYILPKVHELWSSHGLPPYTNVKVTKSHGRWGSCSGKNRLCFSYRLAEYLENQTDFIDAIIIHELAHLKYKHHKKSFWNQVYEMMPHYEEVIKKAPILRSL